MGYAIVCKACNQPIGGKDRVVIKRLGSLCVDCVSKLHTKNNVPSKLDDFIVWYKANMVEAPTVKLENERLRKRLEENEAQLAAIKRMLSAKGIEIA